MSRTTIIIDGDTNSIIEVRLLRYYPVTEETFEVFREEFKKEVVFAASNADFPIAKDTFEAFRDQFKQEVVFADGYDNDFAVFILKDKANKAL